MNDSRDAVRIEKRGRVATVVLSRPSVRNAVDAGTASALAAAFRSFDADSESDVAVLWGEHGTFCSGADLRAITEGQGNRLAVDGDAPLGISRLLLTKPVIAAISGHAVGGGLELALWCDLRVMEEDAVLGFFNRRWGIPLIDGGTVRLPRLIGLSRALDLILTGRAVGAAEALAIGLVQRVVPKGASREESQRLAAEIAAFPQPALRADRRSAIEHDGATLIAALEDEFRGGAEALRTWQPTGDLLRFVSRKDNRS